MTELTEDHWADIVRSLVMPIAPRGLSGYEGYADDLAGDREVRRTRRGIGQRADAVERGD